MKRFLTISGLLVAIIIMVITFLTARNYTQLAAASVVYPMLVYLVFRYFPRQHPTDIDLSIPAMHQVSTHTASAQVLGYPALEVNSITSDENEDNDSEKEKGGVLDLNKREFLKLVGAAGLSFFIFSILTKKAEGLLFGRTADSGVVALEDPEGNKVYPAERQLTDNYQISEIDEGDDYLYCGYTNKKSNWYIMKQDSDGGSFRYTKGDSNFPGYWQDRENLKYDYFHNVFS